ncbi:cytochrome b [Protaetiibacter larvae]|uniref:Cytochrome bc1 complex cytochrome b subunit n=1 Tax=Protaetiibacter larvae TaxID=2592654 RepID=A0A5C1Y7J7_9MICO|nr:cytochrome bc complex cytochrome b subunit [Protaetiibacter larvae]QEO08867.1 cytochrome bc complex cytochrome b subunit [Protaetiibacter larvae]
MAPTTGGGVTTRLARWLDDRTSISGAVAGLGRKIFPDHWSFLLGEVALYSFVALLLTGTFLTFFFQASMAPVIYEGSYPTLKGVEMSAAMASTLDISFDIRGGLLMRQAHHWAALLFVSSIGLHMLRIFFTGAFRKPRELNWVFGFLLFVLAMAEGFTGYSLPDDLLSGNGLRIADGIAKGIPVVGTWISYLLFGGEFPGEAIVGRFYALHILLIPAILLALIGVHLVMVFLHKHTQFAGPGRTQHNVVGQPILPAYAGKAGGFFFIVFGAIMLLAATVTINPIWNYGPYDPSPVSAGTQPDWYIGFADGVLRLVPPGWELDLFGYTLSLNIFIPVVVLMLFLASVAFYPFLEAFITGDKREHHLADRPRNAPMRTAIGAAGVTFYAVMWAAASSDLISTHFRLAVEGVTLTIQLLLFAGPVIAFVVARRVCFALQKKDREIVLHGYETGRIVRMPGGRYEEVHEQLSEYERWRLLDYHEYAPLVVRPDENGRIRLATRIRGVLSRLFFEERIAPVTRTELENAREH